MNIFLVPPHADFTLSWPVPPGFELLDLARGFVERALSPAELQAAAGRLERALPAAGQDGPLRLLQLRAALALPGEAGDVQRSLRAAGAALAGISAAPSPVRLMLDDIALASGTTLRSRDALAAAAQPGAPYQPELDAAVERCGQAGTVRLWLSRDQQLPATLFLAQRLAGRSLELAGPFAREHRAALARLDALRDCRWIEEDSPLPTLASRAELAWRDSESLLLPGPGRAWAGRVRLAELVRPGPLAASDCRVAVLPFAAVGEEVLGADGEAWPWSDVERAADALRGRGGRLVGEWWIGAPGVGAETLARSIERLDRTPLFDWLAALRVFHWPAARPGGRWGRVDVQIGELPADQDLARTRPFQAPGTLSPEECAGQLERLAAHLRVRAPLAPGRVARAYVDLPPPLPARGGRLQLDPDCAIVPLPVSLEGAPGPVTYAANLRTGTVLKLDPRLVPALSALRASAPAGELFGKLPEAARAALVKALVDKSVLREVP